MSDTFEIIDVPGGHFTTAADIKDAGEIAGSYRDAKDKWHGFIGFPAIDVPGAFYTLPEGINDAEQVVGTYLTDDGHGPFPSEDGSTPNPINHGFIYTGGAFTTIDIPGVNYTSILRINGNGLVLGEYFVFTPGHTEVHSFTIQTQK